MSPFTLEVETIEGEEIDLEGTKAELVRGKNIVIGAGCEIERVEYTETLTVDKSSRIGEQVKV